MSNYHILRQTEAKHEVQVVFHFPVPAEVNSASVTLSECVKQDLQPTASLVPWLETSNATEHAAILKGEIIERLQTIAFNANMSLAEKRAVIDARFTALSAVIADKIRNAYQWWGTDRDV